MFPEEYPHKCLMIEVKSKSLPERVMKLIENITEKEAKKLQGQYQVNIFYRVSSSITMTFNFKWGREGDGTDHDTYGLNGILIKMTSICL